MNNKFLGCIIGGALGDAIGYPIEFQPRPKYTIKDIPKKLLVSDDTQMTLFTLEALIRLKASNDFSNLNIDTCFTDSYIRWLYTQDPMHKDTEHLYQVNKNSRLLRNPKMFASRAPGTTCLMALSNLNYGMTPDNNSKGCGSVMRVAPIGFLELPVEILINLSIRNSRLTHRHVMSDLSSAFLTLLINNCCYYSTDLYECILKAKEDFKGYFELTTKEETFYALYFKPFMSLIDKACKLSLGDSSKKFCIDLLGEGWVAEEALAIGLFSALRYQDDFTKAVMCASVHKGDSDSTASICGQILGALRGIEFLPKGLVKRLELVNEMTLLVADFICDVNQFDLDFDYGGSL